MEIAGLQTKDGVSTATSDISATVVRDQGYHVATMTNGDTWSVSYSNTTHLKKDGSPEPGKGTWAFLGGTGKLKGIKGKGTYECKPAADESFSCDVEGEYTLPKQIVPGRVSACWLLPLHGLCGLVVAEPELASVDG